MQFYSRYESPFGEITIAADEEGIIGLWFKDQKYFGRGLSKDAIEQETDVILEAKKWLDTYFAGKKPDFMPKLHMVGTEFQLAVWKALQAIPYGSTTTYGELAKQVKTESGAVSPRAVGSAVGHNPILLFVPCHRVIGKDGQLTGYAAGVERKKALLALEKKASK